MPATVTRRPIVRKSGRFAELPSADTLGLPLLTYAQLLALTGMADGALAPVSDTGDQGIAWWSYSSTRGRWVPVGGVIRYKNGGSLAAPLASITGTTATTAFTLPGGNPALPPGFLSGGMLINGQALIKKNGANGTFNAQLKIGTLNSNSDPSIYTISAIANTDQRGLWVFTEIPVSSATVFTRTTSTSAATPGVSTVGLWADNTSNFDTAAAMWARITISGQNAADSLDLIAYQFEFKI